MIEERVGNLLEQPDLNIIVHQANLYHTFGAGIAAKIKVKYPEACAADLETPYADSKKLGTYSIAHAHDCKEIVNLYSQIGISAIHRTTDYEAMRQALTALCRNIFSKPCIIPVIGVPYKLGCGLAGGSWEKVRGILESIFGEHGEYWTIPLVICKLPEVK